MPASRDIVRHPSQVAGAERARLLGQHGGILWLTGLSGSGKSTIAYALERRLTGERRIAYVLDGDNLRHGLSSDLGFAPADRTENIRRVSEVAALFADAGVLCVTSFISPYRADRDRARQLVAPERFVEIYLDVSIEVCERRDPKGLYRRARRGEVRDFTGVSAPYEAPTKAEVVLDTDRLDLAACVEAIVSHLRTNGFFSVGT